MTKSTSNKRTSTQPRRCARTRCPRSPVGRSKYCGKTCLEEVCKKADRDLARALRALQARFRQPQGRPTLAEVRPLVAGLHGQRRDRALDEFLALSKMAAELENAIAHRTWVKSLFTTAPPRPVAAGPVKTIGVTREQSLGGTSTKSIAVGTRSPSTTAAPRALAKLRVLIAHRPLFLEEFLEALAHRGEDLAWRLVADSELSPILDTKENNQRTPPTMALPDLLNRLEDELHAGREADEVLVSVSLTLPDWNHDRARQLAPLFGERLRAMGARGLLMALDRRKTTGASHWHGVAIIPQVPSRRAAREAVAKAWAAISCASLDCVRITTISGWNAFVASADLAGT